jgi:hypothetical protein
MTQIDTDLKPPVPDRIRPVLQAKPVLEINFYAGFSLHSRVSNETGGGQPLILRGKGNRLACAGQGESRESDIRCQHLAHAE